MGAWGAGLYQDDVAEDVLCNPEMPEIYWVNRFTYKCKDCRVTFDIVTANGNDIIKLKEINGNEEKWLPTYGKGGYLDLLQKLLPDFSLKDEITQKKATIFISELNRHCERSIHNNGFDFDYFTTVCTNCHSKNTEYVSEERLVNSELSWLKISGSLME